MDKLSKPNGDGLYWVNDVAAYGWEPVRVRGNTYEIIGVGERFPINLRSQIEWIKLEKPK